MLLFLVCLRIPLFFSRAKTKRKLTIDTDIAHSIYPILLILSSTIVGMELTGKESKHGIAAHEDCASELDDRHRLGRIESSDGAVFGCAELVEVVANVVVGNAGVFEEESQHLASPAREPVEVMERRHAADGLVGTGNRAIRFFRGHDAEEAESTALESFPRQMGW